jgi:hypothetical protein
MTFRALYTDMLRNGIKLSSKVWVFKISLDLLRSRGRMLDWSQCRGLVGDRVSDTSLVSVLIGGVSLRFICSGPLPPWGSWGEPKTLREKWDRFPKARNDRKHHCLDLAVAVSAPHQHLYTESWRSWRCLLPRLRSKVCHGLRSKPIVCKNPTRCRILDDP